MAAWSASVIVHAAVALSMGDPRSAPPADDVDLFEEEADEDEASEEPELPRLRRVELALVRLPPERDAPVDDSEELVEEEENDPEMQHLPPTEVQPAEKEPLAFDVEEELEELELEPEEEELEPVPEAPTPVPVEEEAVALRYVDVSESLEIARDADFVSAHDVAALEESREAVVAVDPGAVRPTATSVAYREPSPNPTPQKEQEEGAKDAKVEPERDAEHDAEPAPEQDVGDEERTKAEEREIATVEEKVLAVEALPEVRTSTHVPAVAEVGLEQARSGRPGEVRPAREALEGDDVAEEGDDEAVLSDFDEEQEGEDEEMVARDLKAQQSSTTANRKTRAVASGDPRSMRTHESIAAATSSQAVFEDPTVVTAFNARRTELGVWMSEVHQTVRLAYAQQELPVERRVFPPKGVTEWQFVVKPSGRVVDVAMTRGSGAADVDLMGRSSIPDRVEAPPDRRATLVRFAFRYGEAVTPIAAAAMP